MISKFKVRMRKYEIKTLKSWPGGCRGYSRKQQYNMWIVTMEVKYGFK